MRNRHAVFIDLGWTLGCIDGGSESLATFKLYPDATDALKLLNEAGLICVVVSNQMRIAYGTRTMAEVDELRGRIYATLAREGVRIDGWYVCPHSDEDGCTCRKPRTGLFEQAAVDLDIDLTGSWVVGDLWRDVAAGNAVGARTIQVIRGDGSPTNAATGTDNAAATATTHDLIGAIRLILGRRARRLF